MYQTIIHPIFPTWCRWLWSQLIRCNYCTNVTFPNGVEPITSVVTEWNQQHYECRRGWNSGFRRFYKLGSKCHVASDCLIPFKWKNTGKYTNKIVVLHRLESKWNVYDSNGSMRGTLLSDISIQPEQLVKYQQVNSCPYPQLELTGDAGYEKYVEVPCTSGWGQGEDYTINVIPNRRLELL